MLKVTRLLVLALMIISIIAFSFGAGFATSYQELKIIWEVWDILKRDFVDQEALDDPEVLKALIEALREGDVEILIDALGDPYTSYLDAHTYQLWQSDLEGSFGGIGATVSIKKDGQLIIVAPIEGSPAEKAGIRAGDLILEINGEPTSGMSLTEAVLKIRGEPGTEVTLLILHQGDSIPQEITIVRETIELESVFYNLLEDYDYDIAYIKITYFSQTTDDELEDILLRLQGKELIGIILDLRDNPGGLLYATMEVASEFLEEGSVVLYEVDGEGMWVWAASQGGLATDLPLVVLVNGGSASGAEILAGALQDHDRALLIGTTTFGKGSVNLIYELSDGSAIYVTIAHWLTPGGHLIEGTGLTPDILVEGEEEQLEQAIKVILEATGEY